MVPLREWEERSEWIEKGGIEKTKGHSPPLRGQASLSEGEKERKGRNDGGKKGKKSAAEHLEKPIFRPIPCSFERSKGKGNKRGGHKAETQNFKKKKSNVKVKKKS